jgi:predicted DNA-binding protein (UPF0251 family)
MPRTKKQRIIAHRPPVAVFKPAGLPARELQWVTLPLDEYEALRLADYEGLDQEAVAERLGVSRPTVSRMLEQARQKVARVLVEGQALAIEGGPVVFAPRGLGHGGGGRHRHGWRGGRGGGG